MRKLVYVSMLTFLWFHGFAGKVDTINVYSNAMHKEIKCVIVTPSNYNNTQTKYPVVYLLHGHSGNYSSWIKTAPQLSTTVDEMQAIIVCPDGGFNSWYFDSEKDTAVKYETFVSKELVSYIDKNYRSNADRKYRAITGLSMGGHGGMYLAIRHKDVFGACGSTSGGVDIRPFPNNWQIKNVLGDINTDKENWEKNSVINLVDQLKEKELSIIIDCGLDDFFLEVNRNLHTKLQQLKISHDYIERPGAHNGAYWNNSIDYQLLFFKKFFTTK